MTGIPVAAFAAVTASSGVHLSLATVLAIIGIVSFFLTAAGIVGMGFRVGSNTQAMANYRETAQSWKEKADAQESQITRLEESSAAKDQQIAQLQAKVEILERLVVGESTAKRLTDKIDHLQDDVSAILDEVKS